MPEILEKISAIEDRYEELNRQLELNVEDYQRAAELGKERSDLEPIVNKAREYRQVLHSLSEAQDLLGTADEELRVLAQAEMEELAPKAELLARELRALLVPKDPRDDRNVIVEIRGGTGGDEAALFAADLYRMYTRYAERHNWKVEVLSMNETGIGGFKEIIFQIKGKGAYSRLKFESGVHRVQRVPAHRSPGTHSHLHRHRGRAG